MPCIRGYFLQLVSKSRRHCLGQSATLITLAAGSRLAHTGASTDTFCTLQSIVCLFQPLFPIRKRLSLHSTVLLVSFTFATPGCGCDRSSATMMQRAIAKSQSALLWLRFEKGAAGPDTSKVPDCPSPPAPPSCVFPTVSLHLPLTCRPSPPAFLIILAPLCSLSSLLRGFFSCSFFLHSS